MTADAARLAAERDMRELRDHFAMRALPWCCVQVSKSVSDVEQHAFEAAERAYVIADAMIRARS